MFRVIQDSYSKIADCFIADGLICCSTCVKVAMCQLFSKANLV